MFTSNKPSEFTTVIVNAFKMCVHHNFANFDASACAAHHKLAKAGNINELCIVDVVTRH